MSNVVCVSCENAFPVQSMQVCKDCGGYICYECSHDQSGYCSHCGDSF